MAVPVAVAQLSLMQQMMHEAMRFIARGISEQPWGLIDSLSMLEHRTTP